MSSGNGTMREMLDLTPTSGGGDSTLLRLGVGAAAIVVAITAA